MQETEQNVLLLRTGNAIFNSFVTLSLSKGGSISILTIVK
jgi:hypothetical protein